MMQQFKSPVVYQGLSRNFFAPYEGALVKEFDEESGRMQYYIDIGARWVKIYAYKVKGSDDDYTNVDDGL